MKNANTVEFGVASLEVAVASGEDTLVGSDEYDVVASCYLFLA